MLFEGVGSASYRSFTDSQKDPQSPSRGVSEAMTLVSGVGYSISQTVLTHKFVFCR